MEKLMLPFKNKHFISIKSIILITILILSILISAIYYTKQTKSFQSKINLYKKIHESLSVADSVNLLYNYSLQKTSFKITFLEFGSVGCRECKKMEEVMNEVKRKYSKSVNVIFYNLRDKKNKKIAKCFDIQMIPTQILLDKNGKECFRHVGFYSFQDLTNEFRKYDNF